MIILKPLTDAYKRIMMQKRYSSKSKLISLLRKISPYRFIVLPGYKGVAWFNLILWLKEIK